MRLPWRLADLGLFLRNNWRAAPPRSHRESRPLWLRPLEERRVLSVTVAVAVDPTAMGAEMSSGAPAAPPPPTVDPVKPVVAQTDVPDTKAPAITAAVEANGPLAQTISSAPGEVSPQGISEEILPTLEVVPDQSTDEGSLLDLTDIGTFTAPLQGESPGVFTFTIDWGDGTTANTGTARIDGDFEGIVFGSFDGKHTYADDGLYTVTVTLETESGVSVENSFQVDVANVPPRLTVIESYTTDEGTPFTITDMATFTDPGFTREESNRGENAEDFGYFIDWGDGTPLESGVPTRFTPGAEGTDSQGAIDGSHVYADDGQYTVTITLFDDDDVVEASFTILVNNVAPTLTVVGTQTTDEGSQINIPDMVTFTDPGFQRPGDTRGENQEDFGYFVDWGDGTPLESGVPTRFTPGGVGQNSSGAIDGTHVYADDGEYTVTVTVFDDDDVVETTFTIVVNNVPPNLIVTGTHETDEGSRITIVDLGTFTDPGFSRASSSGETVEDFGYFIDWGDGTGLESGAPARFTPGAVDVLSSGAFDGSHIYSDDGEYTVTVTLFDDDDVVEATFTIIVNNVPPNLILVGPQTVNPGQNLVLVDLGTFTDPGFQRPGDARGESLEDFGWFIDWGDGTTLESGVPVRYQPGSEGVLSAGAIDSSHTYANPGTYIVTVTLFDDDDVVLDTFTVTVNDTTIIFIPPSDPFVLRAGGAGGGTTFIPPPPVNLDKAAIPLAADTPIEYRRFRAGGVAGAEPRLVLREISAAGFEDKSHDRPLENQVLDDLRRLFRRLPDGNYRIYQIQPDGIERLVIDVIVRQGRSIDAQDDAESLPELEPTELPPPEAAPATRQVPFEQTRLEAAPPEQLSAAVDAPASTEASFAAAAVALAATSQSPLDSNGRLRHPRLRKRRIDPFSKTSRLLKRLR